MKAQCLQENLSKGLDIVTRASAKRATLPILEHVLVQTDDGRLRLSATDLAIGMHVWIGAKVEEEGAITVPARTIVDLMREFPPERVDLEVSKATLNLACGRNVANIKGMDASEFPLVPVPSEAVPLNAEDLKQVIKRAVVSAAGNESRPILTGCSVKASDGLVIMAAADGFRLSKCQASLGESTAPFDVIVPARAMQELARLDPETVQVQLDPQNRILFDCGDVVLVSQLINGNFPDYNQIIPDEWVIRITVGTDALLRALKSVRVFARDGADIVKLVISADTLTVSAVSAETGDGVAALDAQVEGDPIEIAFSVRYLMDGLEVLGADEAVLEFTTPSSPGLLHPAGAYGFQYVIMPMHLWR